MGCGSKTVTQQTMLVCTECGNNAFIWRLSSKRRAKGHVKHMYCPVCMKVTAHKEKGID